MVAWRDSTIAGSQISTSITIIDSLHGYLALSLTEYNTSAAASIAAGSVCEIAGAFFNFPADELIEASTWTSIVTGNTAYIALTASGTAGSQVVTATYTSTAPTWRDDLQGWYASAASTVRIVGSVYKAEATNYAAKLVFDGPKQGLTPTTVRSLSVASTLAVSGAVTINGITVIPLRSTTESFYRASFDDFVATTLTTLSTVYGILGGYVSISGGVGNVYPATLFVSGGTMYGAHSVGVVTNATFIVSYSY